MMLTTRHSLATFLLFSIGCGSPEADPIIVMPTYGGAPRSRSSTLELSGGLPNAIYHPNTAYGEIGGLYESSATLAPVVTNSGGTPGAARSSTRATGPDGSGGFAQGKATTPGSGGMGTTANPDARGSGGTTDELPLRQAGGAPATHARSSGGLSIATPSPSASGGTDAVSSLTKATALSTGGAVVYIPHGSGGWTMEPSDAAGGTTALGGFDISPDCGSSVPLSIGLSFGAVGGAASSGNDCCTALALIEQYPDGGQCVASSRCEASKPCDGDEYCGPTERCDTTDGVQICGKWLGTCAPAN